MNVSNYINSRPFLQPEPTLLYSQHQALHKDKLSHLFHFFFFPLAEVALGCLTTRRTEAGSRLARAARQAGTMHPHSGQIAVRLSLRRVRASNAARYLRLATPSLPSPHLSPCPPPLSLHSSGYKNTLERSPSNREKHPSKRLKPSFPSA